MSKVLFINGCNNATSYTHQIASVFVDEYSKVHKDDDIITRNLYEGGVKFLTIDDINERTKENFEIEPEREIFKYVNEFLEADKIIIAAPFWNLSIPAILHAYLEHISIPDITYVQKAHGYVGLCKSKKIVHIVTRGYYSSRIEYGDSYLRAFFATLGIKDFRTIALEGTDVHIGHEEKFFSKSAEKAKALAQIW